MCIVQSRNIEMWCFEYWLLVKHVFIKEEKVAWNTCVLTILYILLASSANIASPTKQNSVAQWDHALLHYKCMSIYAYQEGKCYCRNYHCHLKSLKSWYNSRCSTKGYGWLQEVELYTTTTSCFISNIWFLTMPYSTINHVKHTKAKHWIHGTNNSRLCSVTPHSKMLHIENLLNLAVVGLTTYVCYTQFGYR